eukprot:NODE_1088_length_1019_cov_92.687220_g1043_i0.p1 GENE.NODE_1088_length_1019_cov_92.687220_g1043_i0~~NODE_1088_length_1019_cov_92.687220_g1043_i0.p1  ORF type:complete len:297 (-),score=45.80 NODE_1088_length_1019_cov_92.687220_g1043_i0:13-903(-)
MASLVVGWNVSEKKRQQFMGPFAAYLESQGVKCVEVPLEDCTSLPPKVDVYVHKLVDELASMDSNEQYRDKIEKQRHFVDGLSASAVVLEPLPKVTSIMCRRNIHNVLSTTDGVPVPSSVFWDCGDPPSTAHMKYPLLCKPVGACGTRATHDMMIVDNAKNLKEVAAHIPLPLVIQEFLPHSNVVWKVYVIGQRSWVFPRESVAQKPVNTVFNSQEKGGKPEATDPPPAADVEQIVKHTVAALGLELLGLDLIFTPSRELFVVDVNYLPSYTEVPDKFKELLQYMRDRSQRQKLNE